MDGSIRKAGIGCSRGKESHLVEGGATSGQLFEEKRPEMQPSRGACGYSSGLLRRCARGRDRNG